MAGTADILTYRDHPEVAGLDFSMMGAVDLANIALQRWDVFFDVPRFRRSIFGNWTRGNPEPLAEAVQKMGDEIAYRAAATIYAEYLKMGSVLERFQPHSIADIGCGYALFDLFVARNHDVSLLLIDIEENDKTHFVFAEEGSAYNDLAVTRRILEANGVASDAIRTLNPKTEDLTNAGPVDFACSWLSCGFHYPVSMYGDFFAHQVLPGGAVVVDVNPKAEASERTELEKIGMVEHVWKDGDAVRLMAVKD